MQAIEFETIIDKKGHIILPKNFEYTYGQFVKLIVLLPEQNSSIKKKRKQGSAKGILKIVSDDDSHLDDFKEYMI